MPAKRIKIGISIGRRDEDIAAWYNMLKENGLSISEWTVYLVLAYLREDEQFDIGTIAEAPIPVNITANMFGSGNSQSAETGRGCSVKEGSCVVVSVMNQQAMAALLDIKGKGWSYSKFIKILIRKYIRKGTKAVPPDSCIETQVQMTCSSFVPEKAPDDMQENTIPELVSEEKLWRDKKKKRKHHQQEQKAPRNPEPKTEERRCKENGEPKPIETRLPSQNRPPVKKLNTELSGKSDKPKEAKTGENRLEREQTVSQQTNPSMIGFEEEESGGKEPEKAVAPASEQPKTSGIKNPFLGLIM